MKSLKKSVISNLWAMTISEGIDQNEVILLTASGIISGKVLSISDQEDALAQLVKPIADGYFVETATSSEDLSATDGFILLKDVTLVQNSIKTTFPNLVVFFDQIIGITLGKINR